MLCIVVTYTLFINAALRSIYRLYVRLTSVVIHLLCEIVWPLSLSLSLCPSRWYSFLFLSFSLLRSDPLILFFSLSSVSIAFNLELPRYRITLRSTRLLEVLEILGESHYEFYGSTGTCTNTRWWCNCLTGSLGALFQRFMIFLLLLISVFRLSIYRPLCDIKTQ